MTTGTLLRSRRTALAAALLAALVVALVAARARSGRGWVEVRRGDVVVGVEVTGVLKAARSSQLGPNRVGDQWEFKISQLAPEGSRVHQGQAVLGFDTSELERTLETRRAERDSARKQAEKCRVEMALARHDNELAVAEAEATLRKAVLKAERPEELVSGIEARKAVLDRTLAESSLAYRRERSARALEVAQAQLAGFTETERRAGDVVTEIGQAIGSMTVLAPRDGIVVYLTGWRDEKKKVGDTCGVWERAIEIPDLSVMLGRGEVDEADSGKLAEGQRVTLRLDALPDLELGGRVAAVTRAVERRSWDSPLKVVRLEVALDRTDPDTMRPGMRFRGTVEIGRAVGVVTVPAAALQPTADGPVVWRRTALGATRTAVEVGARNDELAEVRSGLAAGDWVLGRPPAGEGS